MLNLDGFTLGFYICLPALLVFCCPCWVDYRSELTSFRDVYRVITLDVLGGLSGLLQEH